MPEIINKIYFIWLKRFLSVILCCFLISNCSYVINPYTTSAAAILGGYDKLTKRKVWIEYANQGDVYAQWELANSYCCNEFEGGHDYKKAVKWFCTAAENGFSKAQLVIGRLYRNTKKFDNIKIEKDIIKAYIWFSLAARRANVEASENKKELEILLTKEELEQTKQVLDNFQNFSCKKIL